MCATSCLQQCFTTYNLIGQREYNVSNEDDKDWLYQMYVAYYCEGCSAAQLTQYKNNEIKQEFSKEKDYFWYNSDVRLYIDMRCSKVYTNKLEKLTRDNGGVTIKLKQPAAKKWGWELLSIHRLNIGIPAQIRVI